MEIYPQHRSEAKFRKIGPLKAIKFSPRDITDGQHLADRHFNGNFSEMVRVLIRAEMEREIKRR